KVCVGRSAGQDVQEPLLHGERTQLVSNELVVATEEIPCIAESDEVLPATSSFVQANRVLKRFNCLRRIQHRRTAIIRQYLATIGSDPEREEFWQFGVETDA